MAPEFLEVWKSASNEKLAATAALSAIFGRHCYAGLAERLGILSHPSLRKHRKEIEKLSEKFTETFTTNFHQKVSLPEIVVTAQNDSRKNINEEETFHLKVSPESFGEKLDEKPKRKKKPKESDEALEFRRHLKQVYKDGIFQSYNGKVVVADSADLHRYIKQFSQKVPKEAAADVITFYCSHPKKFYVEKTHDAKWMANDAEPLYREWQLGTHMTSSRAQKTETNVSNDMVVRNYIQKLKKEHEENGGATG